MHCLNDPMLVSGSLVGIEENQQIDKLNQRIDKLIPMMNSSTPKASANEQAAQQQQSLSTDHNGLLSADSSLFNSYCSNKYESKPNVRLLGSGFDGKCYVEDEQTVIKVYKNYHPSGTTGLQLIQREASNLQALAQLNAPSSILEFVSINETERELRTRYRPGAKSLAQYFDMNSGGLPASQAELQDIFSAVLETLTWLHGQGWSHRDCNWTNITWNRQTKTVQLIDFVRATNLAVCHNLDLSQFAHSLRMAAHGDDLKGFSPLPAHFDNRFKRFIACLTEPGIGYAPEDTANILMHWKSGAEPPEVGF
jgi:tRNA A-37 threonylcarbamoyl transferase component Bud32